jgi:hypothetical protein
MAIQIKKEANWNGTFFFKEISRGNSLVTEQN